MYNQAFIPYQGYWSSPFCRWQGQLQNEHAVLCGAETARRFLGQRGWEPKVFDGLVLGTTVPQKKWFFGPPHFASLIGNPKLGGPLIAQACATSATAMNYAALSLEAGNNETILVAAMDRCSNSPYLLWSNPAGPGGKPEAESWMMDGFEMDPVSDVSALQTAEIVAKEYGVTREETDAAALRRYEQYTDALAHERAFQKKYMQPIEVRVSRKKTILVEEDEGITPSTAEGLSGLRPVLPDGVITFGAQTHPADGNAGAVVTTKEIATRLSKDPMITIQILSYGFARAKKAHMAAAVSPSAVIAMDRAGVRVEDLTAIKTHNPFAVNDVVMVKVLGLDERKLNNYGSSMIFGHPQGPTGLRLMIELIEELVQKGGGYGLFAGCAAGDTACSLVLKVS